MESAAILYLHGRIKAALLRQGKKMGASAEDLEEIAQDAVVLTIQKIDNGDFTFSGHDPTAFAAVTAKNMLRNFLRKKKLPSGEFGIKDGHTDENVEKYLIRKELQLQITAFLDKMNDSCRRLIRLRYFDDYRDEEIISRQFTQYTSIDALRNKRSACMKKLGQLMANFKHLLHEL